MIRYTAGPERAQEPLPTKRVLTLAAATAVADAAQAEAERNGWAVTIAVVDDSGQLVLFRYELAEVARETGFVEETGFVALCRSLICCASDFV